MAARVMYLTRSWPRLSQTFIVNEVLALERLGVDLDIWAMAPSGEQVRQPLNRSGVDRWKPYAQWLQPLRDALGPLAHA